MKPIPALVGILIFMSLSLVACGTTPQAPKGDRKIIQVVVAENFWGSIASQVGGSLVKVKSIITDPHADPHSYEPTSTDANAVADAQYVIYNGAGYDAWIGKLLVANPVSSRKTLNIGDFNGKKEGDNPHMWYNPDYVTAVSNKIRDDLKSIDPTHAAALDQSTQEFLTTGLQRYHQLIADIKAKYNGMTVGATESIFSYLAPALGLHLITPTTFLKAVSETTDIAASDEATVEHQITSHQIMILVYNSQNTPNNIQNLLSLAKAKNIPTPTVTETLTPATASFQDWQSGQLQGIETALAQVTGK